MESRRDPGGDGQLYQVHGIPNKLKAARKANIDLVVLSPADQKQCRDSDLTIVPAATVDEALEDSAQAQPVAEAPWQSSGSHSRGGDLLVARCHGGCDGSGAPEHSSPQWRDRTAYARAAQAASQALPQGRTAEAWVRIGEAKGLLGGGSESVQKKFRSPLADLEMLAQIESIRLTGGETENVQRASLLPRDAGQSLVTADHLFRKAFQDYGIDVDAGDPEQVAALVKASAIHVELVAASTTGRTRPTIPRRDRLILIADRVDGRPESITHRIRQAFAESNKSELLKLTKELPVADQEPSTLFLLATALRNAGEVQEALRLLRLAHEIRPQDFWVNLELGKTVLYWKPSGQIDALRYFKAALACGGNNPGVYVYIANTHVQQDNLEAAEASFRQAIRLKPDLFVAHIGLGCLLTSRRMLRDGDLVLERAANLQPRSELANFNLGFVLQLQGKFEAAAEAYRRHRDQAELCRGTQQFRQHTDFARQARRRTERFDRAFSLRPDYAKAHYNRGFALDMQGKTDEAVSSYRTAIKCDPTFALAHFNLAHDLYFEEGKLQEAEAQLQKSLYLVSSSEFDKDRWLRVIAECQRLQRFDQQLSAPIARGGLPATAADSCDRAYIASWPHRKLYRLATELYKHAFELDGRLAENLTQGYRYYAAACAARAGCGLGREVLTAGEAAGFRDQARQWLMADLAEHKSESMMVRRKSPRSRGRWWACGGTIPN